MSEEDTEVLFGGSSEQSAESDNEKSLEERVETLENRVNRLRSAVMPDIRKVETKNGTRIIAESSQTNWFTLEELKEKLHGGDQ